MADEITQIGALPPQAEPVVDVNALRQDMDTGNIAAPTPTVGGGALQKRANMGFALGNLYNDVQRAKTDNVEQQVQQSKVARDRLTQIWAAGANNPALQHDPRVQKQIGQYWKQVMGVDFHAAKGQQFDWNDLAPPKSINDLSPAITKQLLEADPTARRAMVQSMHIVDATDAWINQPRQYSDMAISKFRTDFDATMKRAGDPKNGMTVPALKQFLDANREIMDQAFGPGYADHVLNDDAFGLFASAQSVAQQNLDKLVASTKKVQGLDPKTVADVALDAARAKEATSLTGLNDIKTKYVGTQLKDLPGLDAAKVRDLQARTADSSAAAGHLSQEATQLEIAGAGSGVGQLTSALRAAQAQYATAAANYRTAFNSGFGVPPEVQEAMDNASTAVDTLQASLKSLQSPAVKAAIAAARTGRTTGIQTSPTTGTGNSVPNWNPTNQDRAGNPVMNVNGKWLQKNGSPAVQ